MTKRLIIFGLLAVSSCLWAKQTPPALTPEQEQQFLYYFYASRHAINSQEYAKALVLLHFCEQINPRDGLVKDNMGVIYRALGEDKKAEQYFATAFELAPDDCWRNYVALLLNTEEPHRVRKACTVLETAHKRQPKDTDVAEYLQQIYMRQNAWRQALAMQDKIDALQGYDGNSALNRYRIYYRMGNKQKAVEEVDKYLEQDPTSLYFLLLRFDIYMSANQREDAFELCRQIGKLFPLDEQEYQLMKHNQYCLYYLSIIKSEEADSLVTIGQVERGFETYETAIFLAPLNLYALNNYAYFLSLHGGDLRKAEQMSATTIKEEPDNSTFLDTYGWILHLQGQNSLALFYLRKALENAKDEKDIVVIKEHISEIQGEK